MNANVFMGYFVSGVVTLIGVVTAIVTPMLKLNASIVALNTTMQEVRKNDKVRDERISIHGKEIDELKFKVNDNAHELANHETRIKGLENK